LSQKGSLLAVVLSACVGCDQVTKRLAISTLKDMRPRSFLDNTFRLEYAENRGAFLGLGASLPLGERHALLIVATSLVLGLLAAFVCLRKDLRPLDLAGYAFILAGGFSNIIDRVLAGAVVDFMNVGIGPFRTGIFNVADMTIMTGLACIVLAHVRSSRAAALAPATANRRP